MKGWSLALGDHLLLHAAQRTRTELQKSTPPSIDETAPQHDRNHLCSLPQCLQRKSHILQRLILASCCNHI